MDTKIKYTISLLIPILLMTPMVSFAKKKNLPAESARISKHRDNYILPYYKEDIVNQARFSSLNPNGTPAKDIFVQFQFSLKYRLLGTGSQDDGLYVAYTQKSNWEAYDESAYFRDNDFNPEIFYKMQSGSFGFALGAEHQSNGAGGKNEVSWNRTYLDIKYTKDHGHIRVKPWIRLDDKKDYNPEIEKYLSNGELEIALYLSENKENELKVLMRNITDKNYYFYSASWNFPIFDGLRGYLKYEDGYGLSISNYDVKTTAYGAGFALSF